VIRSPSYNLIVALVGIVLDTFPFKDSNKVKLGLIYVHIVVLFQSNTPVASLN
jgi:hypothetical protein